MADAAVRVRVIRSVVFGKGGMHKQYYNIYQRAELGLRVINVRVHLKTNPPENSLEPLLPRPDQFVTASHLTSYDQIKWILAKGVMKDGLGTHVTARFAAGFAAVVSSNPVDVIKTRFINMKVAKGVELPHKGVVDSAVNTVEAERQERDAQTTVCWAVWITKMIQKISLDAQTGAYNS
nr:mitochondrial dicarboxylate carrier [Tanacetum cinerariifolium]